MNKSNEVSCEHCGAAGEKKVYQSYHGNKQMGDIVDEICSDCQAGKRIAHFITLIGSILVFLGFFVIGSTGVLNDIKPIHILIPFAIVVFIGELVFTAMVFKRAKGISYFFMRIGGMLLRILFTPLYVIYTVSKIGSVR